MKEENESTASSILPVPRNKEEAKQFYDRVSGIYDYLTGQFEQKYAERALGLLAVEEGEIILEIGFGTGHCLKRMAESVGKTGKVYGMDISSGMLKVTRKRLDRAGLADRVELYQGDAAELHFIDETFDGVFMSFTLELFDTPEIPILLGEVKRVIKPGGRIGIVSMSKENGKSLVLRLYEWIHGKWPKYVDCRPIYLEKSLIDAGYKIKEKGKKKLFGLPIEIVVATKEI